MVLENLKSLLEKLILAASRGERTRTGRTVSESPSLIVLVRTGNRSEPNFSRTSPGRGRSGSRRGCLSDGQWGWKPRRRHHSLASSCP